MLMTMIQNRTLKNFANMPIQNEKGVNSDTVINTNNLNSIELIAAEKRG